jgi:hypothetical protein
MTTNLKQYLASYRDAGPVRERLLGLGATMNGLLKVKLGRPMLRVIFLIPVVLGIKRNLSLVKVLITYLAWAHRLYKGGGMRFVVIYLKSSHTLLQQSLGGQRLPDTGPFGARVSRTRSGGLPRVIPVLHRRRISNGDIPTIRLWLSLFSLYRILEIPGKAKLSTITAPSTASPKVIENFKTFIGSFWESIYRREWFKDLDIANWSQWGYAGFVSECLETEPHLISKSAPILSDVSFRAKIASTSPLSILLSARTWLHGYWDSELGLAFRTWIFQTGNKWLLDSVYIWASGAPDPRMHVSKTRDGHLISVEKASPETKKGPKGLNLAWRRILGKLGTKLEAAGKVRVFAMVDPFTQWIFAPLHKAIFKLLKLVKQDGTHNQVKPLVRLLARQRDLRQENRLPGSRLKGAVASGPRHSDRKTSLYSYDLSAATDRLPVSIQVALLVPVLGPILAQAWATLLVGREYYFSHGEEFGGFAPLKYAVGQPMGALSSWAMLALTHHCIVQWAWFRVCKQDSRIWSWYKDYAILGDDVVIMGGRVAGEYLSIMTGLGVEIGAHKSLVSRNGTALEFAKRTFFLGKDVSAVPLPELLVARRNLSAGLELCRKYNLSLGAYCKFLGYGYRALSNLSKRLVSLPTRMRNYILAYSLEVTSQEGRTVTSWLAMKSLNSVYTLTEKALQSARESLIQTLKAELSKYLEKLARELEPKAPKPISGRRPRVQIPVHPGIRGVSAGVLDHLNRTVYERPFFEVRKTVRELLDQVGSLAVDSTTHLSEIWSGIRELELLIGALSGADHLTATPTEIRMGDGLKLIRRWAMLSRHFRSTTK